jgi:hypothetical protein
VINELFDENNYWPDFIYHAIKLEITEVPFFEKKRVKKTNEFKSDK